MFIIHTTCNRSDFVFVHPSKTRNFQLALITCRCEASGCLFDSAWCWCRRGRCQWEDLLVHSLSVTWHRSADKNLSGWWFGCHFSHFPINIGNLIIPLDCHIFQRGGPTTTQLWCPGLCHQTAWVATGNPRTKCDTCDRGTSKPNISAIVHCHVLIAGGYAILCLVFDHSRLTGGIIRFRLDSWIVDDNCRSLFNNLVATF